MKSMLVSLGLRSILALMALSPFCLLSTLAPAQTASIAGTVTDSSGAVILGAEITARNTATNESHSATSGDTGAFSVPNLQIGPYEITVKKEGFKTFHQSIVELTVAQVLTVNATLAPGAINEELTVVSERAADVDRETSELSNLVDSQQIASLPLITRHPYQLVLLSPGTSQTDSSTGGISVNGARDRNNNFMLDGVDNNDTSVPGGFSTVLGANPESTEEFRVITDNFNAEFDRNSGAIIDVITKSGTNSLHGDAYYF